MIYRDPGFLAVVCSAPWSHPTPPLSACCLSFSVFFSVVGRSYWRGGPEWARSQIVRPQEWLALCKSFNTLSLTLSKGPIMGTSLWQKVSPQSVYPSLWIRPSFLILARSSMIFRSLNIKIYRKGGQFQEKEKNEKGIGIRIRGIRCPLGKLSDQLLN